MKRQSMGIKEEFHAKGREKYFQENHSRKCPKSKEGAHPSIRGILTPNIQDPRGTSPWSSIVKILKIQNKESTLKAAREKQSHLQKGKTINKNFKSHEDSEWLLQALKENNCHPRLLHPAKLSVIIKRERKTFHDKGRLKELMTTKPDLQKILESFHLTRKINTSIKPYERINHTRIEIH